jgi:hypothetical protein
MKSPASRRPLPLSPVDADAPETDAVLDAVDPGPDHLIWNEPRATALEGIDADWLPILTREAHAGRQNDPEGLPTHSLFGPIPVGMSGAD